jgi:hypothetical protein
MTTAWGVYTVTITQFDKVIKTIEYTRMSGTAMMEEEYMLRFQYPTSAGYKIDW